MTTDSTSQSQVMAQLESGGSPKVRAKGAPLQAILREWIGQL